MVEELAEGEDAEEDSEEHDGKVECCLCEGLDVGDDALVGVVEEHLKIKTRLIDEKFASVMGECVI